MVDDEARRMRWAQLPEHVRDAVGEVLGSPVVAAVSQPGGFSAGTADRVRARDGSTAFVKAISSQMHAGAASLHRREAHITAALPFDLPAPQLLGVHDDGDWVALVLQDIDGRHPAVPWRNPDLSTVLHAFEDLAAQLTPAPLPDAPSAVHALGEHFAGWDRIAESEPADLEPWAAQRLPQLRSLAADGRAVLKGDTLVHYDIRADNLLITGDGRVVVLDWPWACRGPMWLDTLMLLIDVHLHGGHDIEALIRRGTLVQVDPAAVTAVLVAQTGYALDAARRPAPSGMDHLRQFQRSKADRLLRWVEQRLVT